MTFEKDYKREIEREKNFAKALVEVQEEKDLGLIINNEQNI